MDQGHASADNLTALKAGLLRGRLFTDAEDGATPLVVIINQALARRYFPNQDPDRANAMSQQTWEIGVRTALGAQRSVYKLVMLQAGRLPVAGLAIGLVCSVGHRC